MEWMKYAAMAMATLLIVFGLLALVMAWLTPRALEAPLMKWMLTGERLEPNRKNRVLASAGSVIFGTYILLSLNLHVVPALAALAAWLVVTLVLRRERTPSRSSSA